MAASIASTSSTSIVSKPVEVVAREPSLNGKHAPADSQPAIIEVSRLSKMYKVYPRPSAILSELLFRRKNYCEHWALQDVSFKINEGEIVGIIGANGAGKSTLLSIIAKVLDPTHGQVDIQGQLRAILQLGTGFQIEYTGRENIYMGGYCLGYTKEEIEASMEWIIDFSGLRQAIDRPYRTYSSGMKARLAFSVTFCRKPRVMIIDEALSAGDIAFSQKAVNRIIELCSGGSTALIVSHSDFFIEKLCSRAIYLRQGQLVADGPSRAVIKQYNHDMLSEFAQQEVGAPVARVESSEHAQSDNSKIDVDSCRSSADAHDRLDKDDPSVPPLPQEIQGLLDDPEEICPPILHLNLVQLDEVRVLNRDNEPQQMFHTGDPLTIEFDFVSKVHKDDVAVGIQIFHESGLHISTSTNHVHLTNEGEPRIQIMNLRRGVQTFRVEFPGLFLADGRYTVSIGMSPKLKHFTEVDQLIREHRVAAFGFYRSDTTWKTLYDPPSVWAKVLSPSSTS